ncbi:hypothetical protein NEISICOT_00934 [Neisseria sicca ATCC 29256]|uniref:Uncharacterized protein n=1 Tax=Neisseria sicca ATCC 29256 TaxID=547045 RepID=C6M343_NEISI|nr:hypothetical protein NEISICOT_00934 [Neisseria sicca ATCC 29256]
MRHLFVFRRPFAFALERSSEMFFNNVGNVQTLRPVQVRRTVFYLI